MGEVKSTGGGVGDLCLSQFIKQELISAGYPRFDGVVEKALALMEAVAMAGRVHAYDILAGAQLTATPSVWADASD